MTIDTFEDSGVPVLSELDFPEKRVQLEPEVILAIHLPAERIAHSIEMQSGEVFLRWTNSTNHRTVETGVNRISYRGRLLPDSLEAEDYPNHLQSFRNLSLFLYPTHHYHCHRKLSLCRQEIGSCRKFL